jgi:PKD repeat protein
MKKLLLSLSVFIGLSSISFAQEAYPCHTDEMTEKYIQSLTPQEKVQYEQKRADYLQEIQDYIAAHPEIQTNSGARAVQYTIPVVFHIIHAGGPENISNEQVEDAIRVLNEDFQMLNSDANNVQPEFTSLVADVEVEFKLARKKPNGDCTNGITRTYSTVTNGGSGGDRVSAVQNAHGNWPGDRYLNIFVAADIGGAAGYTYLPQWGANGMSNGIHILHNYVGSIGTGSSFTSRAVTHEVGHWFDLPHPWGGTNTPGCDGTDPTSPCNSLDNCDYDDGVDDTPNTIGWTSCNLNNPNTCDQDNSYWGFDQIDNVENYMDYSYCSKMFTLGQKARMQAALNSSTGGRNNLNTTTNLSSTGVNEPEIMCQADFIADRQVVCQGETVTFSDYSYHVPSGWDWTFQGGSPATSNNQNPTVTYSTPGTYQVQLTATDGTNNATQTKTSYITVLESSSSLPFIEGFENYSNLSTSPWAVENPTGNEFVLENSIGHSGQKSVRLNNFGQPSGRLDNLFSQPIDLSSISNEVTLSFRYAYRKRSSSNDEWLRVFISNNCGESWIQRKTLKGDNLSTLTSTSSWEPSSIEDWTTVHMTNITGSYWVDNFRMRFEFESDGGNNFFLDDINIYQGGPVDEPLSLNEEGHISEFTIYPNPSTDETNVVFTVDNAQKASIEIVNAIGQTVSTSNINAESGKNLVMLNTSDIEAGVYIVRVTINGVQSVKRLMVK